MAPDFKSYLATQVIAEKQTVSYRNVSRALKVHVNAAKCMLYEFYERENKKKAGSIYATYLIAGVRKQDLPSKYGNGASFDDDAPLPSSPPPFTSSMLEPSQRSEGADERYTVPTKTITLAREETFEDAKRQYATISSVHLYSVSPGRLPDLITLTDIGRDIYLNHFIREDPLKHNKTYGVIQNPAVSRRQGTKPNIVTDMLVNAVQSKKDGKHLSKANASGSTGKDANPGVSASNGDSQPSSRDSTPAAQQGKPSLKRDGSSLFKAFAKQSAKPKVAREDTSASTKTLASGTEDKKMADADAAEEGQSEGEDEALFLDTNTRKSASNKRSRDLKKEREDKAAKLRKMMDSDDEAETEVPNVEEASGIQQEPPAAKTGEQGNADVDWSDSDGEKEQRKESQEKEADIEEEEGSQPTAAKEPPKRRRVMKKVIKKRTMKDEDGYLVTREETVMESASEDEPVSEPKPTNSVSNKDKPKTVVSSLKSQTPSSQKSGTGSTKGGGATTTKKKSDIMSFFGKK